MIEQQPLHWERGEGLGTNQVYTYFASSLPFHVMSLEMAESKDLLLGYNPFSLFLEILNVAS